MNRQTTGLVIAAGLAFLAWRFRPLRATVTTSEFIDTDDYLPGSTNYSEPIKRFGQAIAQAEGYGIPGAIPTVCNNPGNLVLPGWSPTVRSMNMATSAGADIAVFDSADYGWSRLYRQLGLIISGQSSYYHLDMSIADMSRIWAGGDDNWGRNVARYLNVPTSTPLWQVLV